MTDEAEVRRLADDFIKAVEIGDRALIEQIYGPTFAFWHNITRADQQRAEAVETAATLAARVPGFGYRNIRRQLFPGGLVQQHDVVWIAATGEHLSIPICMVMHVRDGQIARIEEYYNAQDIR